MTDKEKVAKSMVSKILAARKRPAYPLARKVELELRQAKQEMVSIMYSMESVGCLWGETSIGSLSAAATALYVELSFYAKKMEQILVDNDIAIIEGKYHD